MAWELIGNIRGPAGLGVPPGGTTGQVLTKTSNVDNATAWQTPPGGVNDHGALTGLADDDHPQYHNDARGDARYVNVAGDAMTGALTLPADPAAPLQAATKQYVDSRPAPVLDHGGLTGLGDDDHPQYLLPTEVVAGTNVTVDQPGDGTVVINSTGGGGGATSLDDLTDVDTTGVLDGQALVYDANSGQWVPETIAVGGASTQQLEVCFVADATANLTLTSMAAAEDFLGTSVRHVAKVDLGAYSHVRFVVRRLGTAGAAGAVLNLKYATADPGSTFVGANWTAIPCSVSITAQNVTADSGWIAMPAGMKDINRFLAVTQQGGDGALGPVVGSVRAFFRGEVAAGGGGGGGASTLDQLLDVSVPAPVDEQVLTYVGANSAWEAKPAVKVTVDPALPTGGKDGDLWVQTTDVPWTPPAELPRGIVAWRTYAQTDSVTVGTTTVASIFQLDNVALKANRLYRLTYVSRAAGMGSGAGNIRIFTPGATPIPNTTLMIDNHCYVGASGTSLYGQNVGVCPFTVTVDGNYSLSLNAIAGVASSRVYRTHIMVEDIGPIRGQQ